jgi:hypothetical protein
MEEHMPYEGAGFLMHHEGKFILGIRIKKPEDVVKDPTVEVEYMGGKPEKEDTNDPLTTAFNELAEEVGRNVLDADWRQRTVPIHTFQKFSKKWIWCTLLRLTRTEYNRLLVADYEHDNWNVSETRDLSSVTGRTTPARKAVSRFVELEASDLTTYIQNFSEVSASNNRMNDAKTFRNTSPPLKVTSLFSRTTSSHPLRAFNTVIFEEHVRTIQENSVH